MTDLTRTAIAATAHCLTGCAIGEVAGLVIGTAIGLGNGQTIALAVAVAVALAFVFGYGLTLVQLLRSGRPSGRASGSPWLPIPSRSSSWRSWTTP